MCAIKRVGNYDEDDELSSPYEHKKAGLPPKADEEIAQNDPVGHATLAAGKETRTGENLLLESKNMG